MSGLGEVGKILINQPRTECSGYFINLLKTKRGLEFQYLVMVKAMEYLHCYAYGTEPLMPRLWFDTMVAGKKTLDKMDKETRREALKQLNQMEEVVEYKQKLRNWEVQTMANAFFLENMINVFIEAFDEVNLPKVLKIYNNYPEKIGSWKKKIYAEKNFSEDSSQEPMESGKAKVDTSEGWPV